jgi:hypothetical protein
LGIPRILKILRILWSLGVKKFRHFIDFKDSIFRHKSKDLKDLRVAPGKETHIFFQGFRVPSRKDSEAQ